MDMSRTDGLYHAAELTTKIRELGYFTKITDVAQIMRTIDTSSIFDHFFNATNYVLWDKTSTVSGIPAQDIIGNYNITDKNEAFAVFSEGSLVAFHITAPDGSGKLMTKKEAETFGELTKNNYVVSRTNQEILNVVSDKLMEKEVDSGKEFTPS